MKWLKVNEFLVYRQNYFVTVTQGEFVYLWKINNNTKCFAKSLMAFHLKYIDADAVDANAVAAKDGVIKSIISTNKNINAF